MVCLHTIKVQSISAAEINLAWDPSPSENILFYKIYYGFNKGGPYEYSIDVGLNTNYIITGLQSEKTYYFTVTSIYPNGEESSFSEEITFSFPPDTDPPTNRITLAWDPPANEDIAYYKVYCDYESGPPYDFSGIVGTRTSYTIQGFESGVTYYFTVTSTNKDGEESDYSEELVFSFPPYEESTPVIISNLDPTSTPVYTPVNTPVFTSTPVPTKTPTETATHTPTSTYTPLPTNTGTATPTCTSTITPTNIPPEVELVYTPPLEGAPPLKVSLYGNAIDDDGIINNYSWFFSFGNNRIYSNSTSEVDSIKSYIFYEPGIFDVVFSATDNFNEVTSAAASIVIWTLTPTSSPTGTPAPENTFTPVPPTNTPVIEITPTETPETTEEEDTPTPTYFIVPESLSKYDLDLSKEIDVRDLEMLINSIYNQEKGLIDFNEDGIIDAQDIFLFADKWGKKVD